MPPPTSLRSFAVESDGQVSPHGTEGCYQFAARSSGCSTVTASLTLGGPHAGELHLSFSDYTTHPPRYVVRRIDGPEQPTMDEGRLLLSVVGSALDSGGWQRTCRGGGTGTSLSWSNPHCQSRRR